MPPRGVKKGSKRARQYEHIKDSLEERGEPRAEEIAARTVNKERARSGEARDPSRLSRRMQPAYITGQPCWQTRLDRDRWPADRVDGDASRGELFNPARSRGTTPPPPRCLSYSRAQSLRTSPSSTVSTCRNC